VDLDVVYYLFAGAFMFFLMRSLSFSRAAALLGSLLVMLSPHVVSLASEGHGSKLMAVSYLPLVFLLTHHLFEKRSLLTFGLLAAPLARCCSRTTRKLFTMCSLS